MLATATEAEILHALSVKIAEKNGKTFKFEWLENDLPYLLADIRGAPGEAKRLLDAQRAEQEAQERADAERERLAKAEAELEERRKKARAAVVPPPPLAESEKPCLQTL